MSSESTLILFGLFVAITPYSGIPTFWYAYILPILGIVIIGIGFLFRSRRVSSQNNTLQKISDTSPLVHEQIGVLENDSSTTPVFSSSESSTPAQASMQQTAVPHTEQSPKRKIPSSIS